ncbi:MAG: patatin-like phospholipase family protein [Cyanobacteria bacterium TGS_CYA1]|nr:patatin-like phospholipase family protein [Cyanobacteria bacterium TGS_CYA1]
MFDKLAKTIFALCAVFAFSLDAVHASDSFIETSSCDRWEATNYKRASKPDRLKLGLALGGGGARGAAEVGVLKVLDEAGIKFDYICGTSIGAVVGGFYALGASPLVMQKEFENGNVMEHFMTVPLWFRVAISPVIKLVNVFKEKDYDGLYAGNRFRTYLMGKLTTEEQMIEHLPIPFAAVALNVMDGKPYMIRKGNMGWAMQASCAVPTLRKPVELGDSLFCDGGLICNLPVKQCREMGADVVIAVNIDEPFIPLKKGQLTGFGSMAKRMIAWDLHDLDGPQAKYADITIHPDTTGISLISTKRKDAKRGVKAGEEAARVALPDILKLLQECNIPVSPKRK